MTNWPLITATLARNVFKIAHAIRIDANLSPRQEQEYQDELKLHLSSSNNNGVSRFFLLYCCVALGIDLIVFNNTEPITCSRPFMDEIFNNSSLDLTCKTKLMSQYNAATVVGVLLRFPVNRPGLYGQKLNELVEDSWFVHFTREKGVLLQVTKPNSGLLLASYQHFPETRTLVSEFPDALDNTQFSRKGKEKVVKVKTEHACMKHFTQLPNGAGYLCILCYESTPSKHKIYSTGNSSDTLCIHLKEKHSILVRDKDNEAVSELKSGALDKYVTKIPSPSGLSKDSFKQIALKAVIRSSLGKKLFKNGSWLHEYTSTILESLGCNLKIDYSSQTVTRWIDAEFVTFEEGKANYFKSLGLKKVHATWDCWTTISNMYFLPFYNYFVLINYYLF